MKRERRSREPERQYDLPEPETDEYVGEYSLEAILAEFSDYVEEPEAYGAVSMKSADYGVKKYSGSDISVAAKERWDEPPARYEAEADTTMPEEPAERPTAKAQKDQGPAETSTKASAREHPKAEVRDTPARHHGKHVKKQKVQEDFPDTPVEENLDSRGDFDYSSLFRMFADTRENTGTEAEEVKQPDRVSDSDNPDTKSGAGLGDRDPEHPDSSRAEEPLFAENPLDFRDVLREFMLGDQHPLYADMPGIGQKANSTSAAEDELADLDAALKSMIPRKPSAVNAEQGTSYEAESEPETLPKKTDIGKTKSEPKQKLKLNWKLRAKSSGRAEPDTEVRPEPEPAKASKRDYTAEEDFPADSSENSHGEENNWGIMQEKPAATESKLESGSEAEEAKQPEPDGKETESQEENTAEGRLRTLLRGLGSRTDSVKKRGLNEPKAFARFEDYVPEENSRGEEPISSAGESELPEPEESIKELENLPGESDKTEEEDDEILCSGDFPSFGQWILNELMTVWIRFNGIGDRTSTATMEDDSEDLGKEVNVANASRYYGSQVTMLRMRFQIGLVLLAILAYITLGFPVSGMLKTARVASAMCLGLQLTIMLLCLDIVTNAAVNLTRRRFGADALAVLSCVISSFDALSVTVGGFGTPHIPLCLFSSLALMGILFSSLLSARALRKSTRVPAIGKRVYCVTAEEGVRSNGDLTLLKSVRPTIGFVRRAEESPPDEALFSRSALLQLLAAILLSLLTALFKHSMGDFLYILSAILSCAVPATALLAFALPFFIGSERIFSSGAAVAGWSGIHDIGCSRNLIVTDRDLFPEDTISIETVRVFADDSAERVIGFAGSMIAASGSGLAPCFAELMEKNDCRMRQVEDFQWLTGGGLQGRIEGSTVLCGNSDLMQLMNVKVPYRLVDRTTVLLAIDGVLYGIFKINYIGLPEIRTALQELIASNRHPIFAIRDFNITPDMLHDTFDVATDGYDFPPYGDRFRISEAKPSETSKISAVVCREGLGPLTHLADTGRSMYVAIRLNLIITAAIAVLGMLLVFVKLIGTGEVSAWMPFVLMLLDVILVTLISLFMRF